MRSRVYRGLIIDMLNQTRTRSNLTRSTKSTKPFTIRSICKILHQHYPEKSAESWDHVGLMIGDLNDTTESVVITQDLCTQAIARAEEFKSKLIITHHPPIFPKPTQKKKSNSKRKIKQQENQLILKCQKLGIAVYSSHSNFDLHAKEVSIEIAQQFGLKILGRLDGYGFYGLVSDIKFKSKKKNQTLEKDYNEKQIFVKTQKCFKQKHFTYTASKHKKFKRIAFAAGKTNSFIESAIQKNVDLYITGEIGYHAAREASQKGMAVIELGHTESEYYFIQSIEKMMKKAGLKTFGLHAPLQKKI